MIIRSKNFNLKLEEILKDKLPTERFNEQENNVLRLINHWHSNQSHFVHQTSGSTGRPKKIEISREKIQLSARATMDFIDPSNTLSRSLLCLDPTMIGGAMVVYRALLFKHDLQLISPNRHPLNELAASETFDLVSLAPIQFNHLKPSEIERFNTILIGGAPMPIVENINKSNIYSTFGMTETVSHIALRKINEDIFHTTGDTIIRKNEDDTLSIKGSITDHNWLKTNDIIEQVTSNAFKWIGRADFIINSGGIKLNPETIESQLSSQLTDAFMIGSVPDKDLGEKLVLLCREAPTTLDFSLLPKYSAPKQVYFNQKIYFTASNKIDRKRTLNAFRTSQ